MSFESLGLTEPLLAPIRGEGYQVATPIQLQAIPPLLLGRDMIGCAQTGTGKTAAYALPTLQRLSHRPANGEAANDHGRPKRRIRALILSPTRELASQIGESFSVYGRFVGLRHTVIYGGVSQGAQVRALRAGVDILVATPGRLLDLLGQNCLELAGIEILVLDEADRMLDMGFIHDLRRIVRHVPKRRQTLMFSATMPAEICQLAHEWLHDPASIEVVPPKTSTEMVTQSVYFVEPKNKPLLLTHFLQNTPSSRTIVFARTKHGADKLVRHLTRQKIHAAAIHGNKTQAARQRVLQQFKSQQPPVLVATDVAARGLDVDGISHVINYDLPMEAETYIHRIGRTGRAGASGVAVSFCSSDERPRLRLIERLIRRSIRIEQQQPPYPREAAVPQAPPSKAAHHPARSKPAAQHPPRNKAKRRRRHAVMGRHR